MSYIAWDATFEARPLNTDVVSEGDDRIRDTREQTRDRAKVEHLWGAGTADNGRFRPGALRFFFQNTAPTVLGASDAGTVPSDALDQGRGWIDSGNRNRLWIYDATWEEATAQAGAIDEGVESSTAATYAGGGWRDVAMVSLTTPAAFNSSAWQILVDAKFVGYMPVGGSESIAARIYDGTNAIDASAGLAAGGLVTVSIPLHARVSPPAAGTTYTFKLQVYPIASSWTQGYPSAITGAASGMSRIRAWLAPVATS